MSGTITVQNNIGQPIEVAINTWENSGSASTEYYTISAENDPSDSGSQWNRTDDRGFVMSIKYNTNTVGLYFVTNRSAIIVQQGSVTDHGRTLIALH